MKSWVSTLFALAATGIVALAQAHEYKAGGLEIHHPWARATTAGVSNGAAYFKINNNGAADVLIGASAPTVAKAAELHQHINENGVMRMRPVEKIAIPAKGSLLLAPGGYHLMLLNLKTPLQEGQLLPLTLRFEKAGEVKVDIKVEATTVDADKLHEGH